MKVYYLFSRNGWPIGPDDEVLLTAERPNASGERRHLGMFPNRTAARLWLRERREAAARASNLSWDSIPNGTLVVLPLEDVRDETPKDIEVHS